MIRNELSQTILRALKLESWDLAEETTAAQVPGWDSLSHVNVILAVERTFGVHFKNVEVLRLKNVGDLQRLLDSKLNEAR